jgi:hypothetical protein
MKTIVNPDPHAEGFKPQPIHNITAVLDRLSDVFSVLQSLGKAGFSEEQISVFLGQDGLEKLDLHGERHGMMARVVRALETLTAEDEANRNAEAALKQGRIFIAVSIDGSDQQKANVESILKTHGAHSLRFFGRWTVERL